ncbi:MAG: tagaturonate epimerase [Thermotogaceae bacterium]|nr:tagaturonate epimerase [Thermotogaceae bacterium]
MINLDKKEVFILFNEHLGRGYSIYEKSFKTKGNFALFMVKGNKKKELVLTSKTDDKKGFDVIKKDKIKDYYFHFCELSHKNADTLKKIFPNLNPIPCLNKASFGTGDRLGITTPGHLRAFDNSKLFPFLAQQSVRENERTRRTWKDVLNDVVWGIFQEGYEGEFGADADHIKEEKDLLKAIDEGFTMFTIDPSEYVRELSKLTETQKNEMYQKVVKKLNVDKYLKKSYEIDGKIFKFDEKNLRDAAIVYFDAIEHVEKMYRIIKEKVRIFDFEVSVDETETPTSPLFHIFIAEELRRRNIEFQNLAPRFVGGWQKGIDYIGDVEEFKKEIKIHAEIARYFGGYKLSLHSGSDKFSVYKYFSESTDGLFHVKTAGTSYLEAIKIIAIYSPKLYRRIHEFALKVFDKDKASYHVTTDLSKIPDIDTLSDSELPKLFENNSVRQLIHITYGSVLNAKDERNEYLFRDSIHKILFEYEEEYYSSIAKHIGKHIKLLGY